jgi:hypothetical protein
MVKLDNKQAKNGRKSPPTIKLIGKPIKPYVMDDGRPGSPIVSSKIRILKKMKINPYQWNSYLNNIGKV